MPDSRTVFKLRREGRLTEALEMARVVLRNNPRDDWSIKAAACVLNDLIKQALQDGDRARAAGLMEEFNRLQLPAEATIMANQRARLQEALVPQAQFLKEARQASDAGDHARALALYRQALKEAPGLHGAAVGLGWAIAHALRDCVGQENPDGGAVMRLLREYGELEGVEKPGPLHSIILARAAYCAEHLPNFAAFFQWWDPANLREEDFRPYRVEQTGKIVSSLVERVIRALYRTMDRIENPALLDWATRFVGEHYRRYPEQEWFPYYYAQMLIHSGHAAAARELVLPLVRGKQSEFWAWDVLAQVCAQREEKLACLARALTCNVQDESYRVKVHFNFGLLLLEAGRLPEAKREVETALRIRSERGWRLPEEMQDVVNAEWFEQTEAVADNTGLYHELARAAEALLMADLPWVAAVVSGHQAPDAEHPGRTFIVYAAEEGQVRTATVSHKRHAELAELALGTPLRVRLQARDERWQVVGLERREGTAWDVVPVKEGTVVNVNMKKGVTHLRLGRNATCLLHHGDFPEAAALAVGAVLEVRALHDSRRDIWRGVAIMRRADSKV